MNPGPVEEGGKVATSIIDSLKGQPISIALIVVNLVFVIFVGYFLHDLKEGIGAGQLRRDEMITTLIAAQEKTAQLLYNCAPVDKAK